ncbi:MAG: YaiI/YqxD family protein [Myxococcota bacterium]
MHIWVDADACPAVIKEILFRVAERREIHLTLVANHGMRVPASPLISFLRVQSGFDVADHEIVQRMEPGDLVITNDIPLAAEVIEQGAHALSVRGELFTEENIGARLNVRDFMDALRGSGIETSGPSAFSPKHRKAFADALDRFLAKHTS